MSFEQSGNLGQVVLDNVNGTLEKLQNLRPGGEIFSGDFFTPSMEGWISLPSR